MSIVGALKQNIKGINIQTMSPRVEHRLFLCFLGGVALGTVFTNVFGSRYAGDVNIYGKYLSDNGIALGNHIDKFRYMLYCFGSYMKEFGILFLFNLTPFSKVYNGVYLAYKGLVLGILVSAATFTYGAGGILLYLVSVFPHYIGYVPFVISSIYVSVKMAERIREKTKKVNVKALAIVVVLGLITSVLESYINYPILKLIYG